MENKNTIIALVLMMAVWFGFTVLFPPAEQQDTSSIQPVEVVADTTVKEEDRVLQVQSSSDTSVNVSTEEAVRESLPVTVETDLYVAVFNTANASLEKFELKEYTQGPEKTSPLVSLVDGPGSDAGTLLLRGFDGFTLNEDMVYTSPFSGKSVDLSKGESIEIPFLLTTPLGLTIQKTFVLKGDKYDFSLNVTAQNNTDVSTRGYLTLSLTNLWEESMGESSYEFNGPVTLVGEEVDQVKVDDLSESEKRYASDAVWSSFQTKYFMNACVPLGNTNESVIVKKDDSQIVNTFKSVYSTIQPGEKLSYGYLLYYGPRDLDLLKSSGNRLDEAIDFGFFSIIALPLLKVLKFFYGFFGNYGYSIILLTVIIKAIFWPLTQKSYASMKSMQKLQPEMQKLRERFKNDRERMNREIMELYKKHRVNPLGGCLPMLVQIPVFFALYKVLLDTIDLRHAPFALWITDLSAKDPYYVTPIIMGVTMFLQQKMTPSTMDPAQARIFMLMPIIFTFLFLNFPSGLVIYWLVNNVLTIVQQFFINKSHSH